MIEVAGNLKKSLLFTDDLNGMALSLKVSCFVQLKNNLSLESIMMYFIRLEILWRDICKMGTLSYLIDSQAFID